MANLITIGLFATGLPVFLGILMAYSVISFILGLFLWGAGSIPDDIGQAFMASGFIMGVLLFTGAVMIRYVIQCLEIISTLHHTYTNIYLA